MKLRAALLGVAIVAVAIALLFVRPHPTPGPLLRDFEAYYAGAQTWTDGRDPYGTGVWRTETLVPGVDASREEVLPFVGPPYTLPFFALVTRTPYVVAARVWSSLLVLALVATVLLTLRLTSTRVSVATVLAAATLAIGFAPITSDLALGQAALLAYAGALFAIVTFDRRLIAPLAGALLALVQPNVALPLAVLIVRRRGIAVLAIAGVAACGAAVAAGAALALGYPGVLHAHALAERFLAIQQTPAAIAFGLGAGPARATGIGMAIALAAVAAAFVACRRVTLTAQRFAIACAFVPFVATFFHEHDLLVAFGPALWCARYARGTTRSLALVGTLLVAIDWFGLAQRPDGLLQSALLALAAALAFVVLADDRSSPWAGVVTAAAIFAAGAAIAHAHPAPIWPDAMTPFHLPSTAPIARIWEEEQVRSGLTAPNAWWAVLRMLGLAGCALLAVTTTKSRPVDRDSIAVPVT